MGSGVRKKNEIDQPRNEANSQPLMVVASTST